MPSEHVALAIFFNVITKDYFRFSKHMVDYINKGYC